MHGWEVQTVDEGVVRELARGLNLRTLEARLLATRGIRSVDEAYRFLNPSFDQLHDPFLFNEMETATRILHEAVTRHERILIHGDYDADGVCGTALLYEALSRLGADVDYFVPDRARDGYGLAKRAMEHSVERGLRLVVSVDCGSSDREVVSSLVAQGVTVVITDHHETAGRIPEAHAFINPKLPGEAYPFKELTGAGVAFKLLQGLERTMAMDLHLRDVLDLAALGTLGDNGAMLDENRIIVPFGLEVLRSWRRPGLKALRLEGGLPESGFSARQVSFTLVPRLNSPGRIGSAREVVSLLVTQDAREAARIAREIEEKNRERRGHDSRVTEEACHLADETLRRSERKAFVFSSTSWHEGVVGIGAARLAEQYSLPSVLIAIRDGMGKGSARSAGKVNVKEALERCSRYLVDHGGHREAGGFSIRENDIPDFQVMFEEVVEELMACPSEPGALRADVEVALAECTLDLISFIERMGPFGPRSPEPLLLLRGITVTGTRTVGERNGHLKVEARDGTGATRDLIGFSIASRWKPADIINQAIDVLINLRKNTYNRKTEPQLQIHEMRFSELSRDSRE